MVGTSRDEENQNEDLGENPGRQNKGGINKINVTNCGMRVKNNGIMVNSEVKFKRRELDGGRLEIEGGTVSTNK